MIGVLNFIHGWAGIFKFFRELRALYFNGIAWSPILREWGSNAPSPLVVTLELSLEKWKSGNLTHSDVWIIYVSYYLLVSVKASLNPSWLFFGSKSFLSFCLTHFLVSFRNTPIVHIYELKGLNGQLVTQQSVFIIKRSSNLSFETPMDDHDAPWYWNSLINRGTISPFLFN